MANLAIKGHTTRSKEVIELLKMLGGQNYSHGFLGGTEYNYYYIGNYSTISCIPKENIDNSFVKFTLEEFLDKFPYKVGDKVLYYENPVFITQMEWIEDSVSYHFYYKGRELMLPRKHLQPYKEQETMEEQIKIDIPNGYKFAGVNNDNRQVMLEKIKPKYPNKYQDCANFLNRFVGDKNGGYRCDLITNLQRLLICRDAYWKIAGEQMGLGKPWSPSKSDSVYCIFRLKGEIIKDNFVFGDSLILEFPTEEMRDAFFENFGHLIEICKELL